VAPIGGSRRARTHCPRGDWSSDKSQSVPTTSDEKYREMLADMDAVQVDDFVFDRTGAMKAVNPRIHPLKSAARVGENPVPSE